MNKEKKSILLIDNFDSFSYNLYQLIGSIYPYIKVERNTIALDEIEKINPCALIISPGPGKPSDAGVCIEAIKHFKGKMPILGICLGHQAITEAFGGKVVYADKIMHGKTSTVTVDTTSKIFKGLNSEIEVARYHSLMSQKETLPDELKITAKTREGVIMALEHKNYEIYGLQFHPESILTLYGKTLARNFLELIQ